MGGFRARDADRDRVIEAIEAAYVDGQLSDVDRDLRVSQALTAASVDELQALTRDLQGAPALAAPPVSTRPAVRSAPDQAAITRRVVGAGIAVVFLVAVLIIGAVVVSLFSATETTTSGTGSAAPTPESFVEETPVAELDTFEMTPADVRTFLSAYEEQFDTLDAYVARFYPTWAGADVPVRGARPRMESWTWNGAWEQDREATAVNHVEIVDLGTLDVRRLFANIAMAERTMNVQDGALTHVIVHRWEGDDPNVNIYVANEYNESGFIRTTLSGKVIDRYPYEP